MTNSVYDTASAGPRTVLLSFSTRRMINTVRNATEHIEVRNVLQERRPIDQQPSTPVRLQRSSLLL